jgi:hypothetical protein
MAYRDNFYDLSDRHRTYIVDAERKMMPSALQSNNPTIKKKQAVYQQHISKAKHQLFISHPHHSERYFTSARQSIIYFTSPPSPLHKNP